MVEKIKSIKLGIIIFALIVIVALAYGIYKITEKNNMEFAKRANDIVIQEEDSDELKKEKITKKIELITQEIEKIQANADTELEKLNKLNEDYVSAMNEEQTATEELTLDTEELTLEQE